MKKQLEFLPIKEKLEDNPVFANNPVCDESLSMCIDFYKKVGFAFPWICYYVKHNDQLVGTAAFKGKPVNGAVEIAYGTFEKNRKQGFGTMICRELVELSLRTDASIRVMARTLPEKNFSTRILEQNRFIFTGDVNDPEDGLVWEWEYKPKE